MQRNFKIFIFSAKILLFIGKITKMKIRVNSQIFTLYMILEIFLKMAITIMVILGKKFENDFKSEFVTIQEFGLVKIFVIFRQKSQFSLEIKNCEVSKNLAWLYGLVFHQTYILGLHRSSSSCNRKEFYS